MFKKIIIFSIAIVLFSCSSKRNPMESKPLYDVLFRSDYGGAPFQFYEIITEQKEFNMLLKDKMIKPYITKEDIETCNFILINLGEKSKKGFTIKVENIEELKDKIVLSINEIEPQTTNLFTTSPCFVIKIKSKKTIEIK
jgi:hypothetical protein